MVGKIFLRLKILWVLPRLRGRDTTEDSPLVSVFFVCRSGEGAIMSEQPEILSDPKHIRGDLRMLETSIRNGWQLPEGLLAYVPRRLTKILQQGTDREATAAARVLVAMKAQNMGPAPAPVVQVGVQVNGNGQSVDDRRAATLAIAERIRAKRIS